MQLPNNKTLDFYYDFREELDDYYETVQSSKVCGGVNPIFFYPEKGNDPYDVIPRFCAKCPVHLQCLLYAIGKSEVGIWGGTPEQLRDLVEIKAREINDSFGATMWTEQLWIDAKELAIKICYTPERQKINIGRPKKNERTYSNPMYVLSDAH